MFGWGVRLTAHAPSPPPPPPRRPALGGWRALTWAEDDDAVKALRGTGLAAPANRR